jgi:hypothetical protein
MEPYRVVRHRGLPRFLNTWFIDVEEVVGLMLWPGRFPLLISVRGRVNLGAWSIARRIRSVEKSKDLIRN